MSTDDRVLLHLDTNNGLERVTELVHTRLVDCGWKDKVRLACRKQISENRNPTVDELIAAVTSNARAMIPDSVKRELLHELEKVLINVDNAAH